MICTYIRIIAGRSRDGSRTVPHVVPEASKWAAAGAYPYETVVVV